MAAAVATAAPAAVGRPPVLVLKPLPAEGFFCWFQETDEWTTVPPRGVSADSSQHDPNELANQTAEATESISKTIQEIQSKTSSSVDSIAEITNIIHQIDDISNTIASSVEEQTATTAEIGHNVAQAAKGSGDIATNISGVAQAAQDTAQGASEAQKASNDLSRMAVELEQIVGRFKI